MSAFARLIGLQGRDFGRKAVGVGAALLIATILVAVAFGFLGLAGYGVLTEHMAPLWAALLVALAALVIAALIVAVTVRSAKQAQRQFVTSVKSSVVASLTPTAFTLAARHAGITGVVVVAGLAFLAARRR